MEFAVDSSEDMFAVGIVVLDKFCAGGWEIAVVAVMSPQLPELISTIIYNSS